MKLSFFKTGELGHITLHSSSNENIVRWDSGIITCMPGKAVSFKVVFLPGKVPATGTTVSADSNLTLSAEGYDRVGDYLKELPVEWTIFSNSVPESGHVMEKRSGAELDIQFVRAGRNYSIRAERTGLPSVVVSNIHVIPGKPAYVIIEDKAENGSEVFNRDLFPAEALTLFSIGYDRNNNRIGPFLSNGLALRDWKTRSPDSRHIFQIYSLG